MKLYKSLLVGALIISCTAAVAQEETEIKSTEENTAQVERVKVRKIAHEMTPEQIAKQQTDKMTGLLSLSEEQTTKVYQLNLMVANKIDVIKKSDMTPERKKEFIEGNRNDRINALNTVLTPEQHAKYVAYVSDKKATQGSTLETAE